MRRPADNPASGRRRPIHGPEDRAIDRAVLPVVGGPAIISGSAAFSETKATYKAGLDYQITPDVMAYVSNATGYLPGSFSSTYAFPAVAPVVFGHTNAESAVSTEIGIKSQWLENRLRANVDVFHTEYQNAQTQATSFPYNVTATNFNYKGVELEVPTPKPFRELTLSGSLGVLGADTDSWDLPWAGGRTLRRRSSIPWARSSQVRRPRSDFVRRNQ